MYRLRDSMIPKAHKISQRRFAGTVSNLKFTGTYTRKFVKSFGTSFVTQNKFRSVITTSARRNVYRLTIEESNGHYLEQYPLFPSHALKETGLDFRGRHRDCARGGRQHNHLLGC